MKKKLLRILLIGCVLASTLFIGGAALAQDEELPDPGITPDSPFYFMDKLSKGLGMAFAFGDEAKARKALQYAEERLAEAQAMANKNRTRQAETAAEEYDSYMARVRQRVEEAVQQGAADNVTERVAAATSNHLAVLERLRERLPEAAQQGIDRAIAASENGQINALRALARNKPEQAVALGQQAIDKGLARLRLAASANASSDNTSIGDSLNYTARLADLEDELVAAAEAAGVDPTRLRQQLAQATANRLEVLAEVRDRAPEPARAGLENAIQNSVRKYERAVERLQASGNVTDNVSLQNRIRNIIKEEVQQQTETRPNRPAEANSDNDSEDTDENDNGNGNGRGNTGRTRAVSP